MTAKQYLKAHPEMYVLVTYEFGEPLYVLPGLKTEISHDRKEAAQWDALSNSEHRLNFYRSTTGYKELKWEAA